MERLQKVKTNKTDRSNQNRIPTRTQPASAVHVLEQLQRRIGNHAVQRFLDTRGIQRQGDAGKPSSSNDRVTRLKKAMPLDEEYTDAAARRPPVSRSIVPLIQRECACGGTCPSCKEKESLAQRRAKGGVPRNARSPVLPDRGRGRSIDSRSRSFMESRFGRDFGEVRLHTDSAAAQAARSLKARAFTVGQDIYFGAGEYRPESRPGRKLLAHELTHTVQQRGSSMASHPSPQTRLKVGLPGGRLEREAERVSRQLVEGEARVGPITAGGATRVQRLELPEIPSWDEIVEGAEEAYEEAVETGEQALETVEELAEGAAELAGEAVDWLASTAGQAALETANALAGLFGGSVVIRRGCIIITIPEIEVFSSFQKTLAESPPIGFFVPLIEGGTMIGPFPVAGMAGILVYGQGSIETAVGPGVVRGIRIELCPFRGSYMATAQFYAAAAIAPRLTLFGGLFGVVGTAIPTIPPKPIILIAQGGLRATGTGWLIGAVQDTVTVLYSGGRLSFSNIAELMGGVLLQGDLDLFAALRLYDKIVCQYVHPLGHWEAGKAWKLTIPIHASLSGRSGTGSIGPITFGPMPIGDIETAIRPLPAGWHCLSWEEIKQILCDKGILPPEMCQEEDGEEVEILKKERALGICKCIGPEECGGGKIWKKCFYVSKEVCKKKGEVNKEAQRLCNSDADLKKKCRDRPKCRFKHVDSKCPVDEKDCKDGYFGAGGGTGTTEKEPCHVPVNYRQTKAQKRGGGALYFEYHWDSSSGDLSDLADCWVGEIVTYPNGDPYVWPSPPWDGGSTPNPTVIWPSPGSDGAMADTHTTKGFKKPYREDGFTATQYYRYKCPCKNGGKPVNLMGPISIVRRVKKKNGDYKYVITKSGKSNSVDPLP